MRKILIKVKPGSKSDELEQLADGSWVARVKAQPVENRANEALCKLVATHFGVKKSQVSIKTGRSGRTKLVQIDT